LIGRIVTSIIEKSQRETLAYKNLQYLKYRIGKLGNIHNHVGVRRRLDQALASLGEGPRNIQFGAGSGYLNEAAETTIEGYVDTDIFGSLPVDVTKKLPLDDNAVDTVFSSHLIEHLHQIEIDVFISESARVLRPGGRMVTATPSYEKVANLVYGTNGPRRDALYEIHGRAMFDRNPTPARTLICLGHINYGHKFLLDFETYTDPCLTQGFARVEHVEQVDIEDPGLKRFFAEKEAHYWLETEIWIATK